MGKYKMIRVVSFAAAVAVAALGAASVAQAQATGPALIVAEMTKDAAKMKAACAKGRDGITAYTSEVTRAMVVGNVRGVKPSDGPPAGEEAAKRCPEFQ
jgi:hypothetical protein